MNQNMRELKAKVQGELFDNATTSDGMTKDYQEGYDRALKVVLRWIECGCKEAEKTLPKKEWAKPTQSLTIEIFPKKKPKKPLPEPDSYDQLSSREWPPKTDPDVYLKHKKGFGD